MKKMFVGMMVLVLMAMMIVPAFGMTIEDAGVVTILKEETIEETVIDEVIVTEDEFNDNEIEDLVDIDVDEGCNYIITIGGDHLIRIQVVRTPGFIQKIGAGFSWIGTKCANGFNHVKGWFVHDEVNE